MLDSQLVYQGYEAPRVRDGGVADVKVLAFFGPGEQIYGNGQKCSRLYRVEFGVVRVCRLLADGRRQISAFHLCGETFGFEAGATHQFFAEAICGTGLSVMTVSSSRVEIAEELLPLALQGLGRAQEHIVVLGRQNAVERIAAFLVDLRERQGALCHVELAMPRTDIADYLGLTVETVSRAFTRLKQMGIIRLPRQRSVEIVKWQALLGMAA